jgi:hypothetical protein
MKALFVAVLIAVLLAVPTVAEATTAAQGASRLARHQFRRDTNIRPSHWHTSCIKRGDAPWRCRSTVWGHRGVDHAKCFYHIVYVGFTPRLTGARGCIL